MRPCAVSDKRSVLTAGRVSYRHRRSSWSRSSGGRPPHPRGAAYRARNWESAATQLGYALNAVAGDQPSQLLRARALNFMQNPPPAEWDAVWNLLDK